MASEEASSKAPYYFAASLSELQKTGKKRVILENGRVVALFYVKDKVYALDHFCYRKSYTVFTLTKLIYFSDTGGPLDMGDIEVCVMCDV